MSGKKNAEEERYVLTEAACMQLALKDFGIEVSIKMAKAIEEEFMESMVRAGYVVENGGGDDGS